MHYVKSATILLQQKPEDVMSKTEHDRRQLDPPLCSVSVNGHVQDFVTDSVVSYQSLPGGWQRQSEGLGFRASVRV